ncbi:NUDIX domain-containing protein [Patescibacteria group bacterium]|nr:NUDIX domain-containing protein [Patescibacteria group bacterium]
MKLKYKNNKLHYVSVTAIIHKKGKYLITKRSPTKTAFPEKWTVPGGKITTRDYFKIPKTTPSAWYGAIIEALKREVKEEVNLEIKNVKFLIDMILLRPDGVPVVVLSYFANYKSGNVKLDEDSTNHVWVTVKDAEKYDLIEGIYEEIIMVDKIIKGANPEKVKFIPKKY